jgi:hypothetical protein
VEEMIQGINLKLLFVQLVVVVVVEVEYFVYLVTVVVAVGSKQLNKSGGSKDLNINNYHTPIHPDPK